MPYMNHIFCKLIRKGELDAIQIDHPLFHATLLLQGAQLIEFSPQKNDFNNLLWLSKSVEYKQGKPLRGGIPICWPWFGNLEKNPDNIQQQVKSEHRSAHGIVRDIPWHIGSIKESCESVIVELEVQSNESTLNIWPFDFSLVARFTFSQTLTLELITENTGKECFAFSQALHTYLPTNDITQTYIHNADQAQYIDALDDWKEKVQQGRVVFNQETDRLYFLKNNSKSEQFELRVESPGQQLTLTTKSSRSAVIWNPWIEKSQRLSQFSAEDYKSMYCIESANVMSDHKTVAPEQKNSIFLQLEL